MPKPAASLDRTKIRNSKTGKRPAKSAPAGGTGGATPAPTLFSTGNDMPEAARGRMVALLNAQLAASLDLWTQVKQAHWNVKGKHFYALHIFFDALAERLEPTIDLLAERATALGGTAMGTARMAASASDLPEYPLVVAGLEHLAALGERYAALAASTRRAATTADDAGDVGTADLMTDIVRILDQDLWMIESHLQRTSRD